MKRSTNMDNKIPKIIHYCWFGGGEKSEIIIKCIDSWKKYCPQYKIIEWNESNYDVNKNDYLKKTYEAKKWAFVSDYARLDVLEQYGGIYLDTDVEIFCDDPFEKYLDNDGVMVFANERVINSGLMYMCTKNNKVCKEMLEAYKNIEVNINKLIACPKMNEPIVRKHFPELKYNNSTQKCGEYLFISSTDYNVDFKHYGTATWCDYIPKCTPKAENAVMRFFRKPSIFEFLENHRLLNKIVPAYTFIVYDLFSMGPMYYVKLKINKIKYNKNK